MFQVEILSLPPLGMSRFNPWFKTYPVIFAFGTESAAIPFIPKIFSQLTTDLAKEWSFDYSVSIFL